MIVFLSLLLSGCALSNQKIDLNKIYRRDMQMTIGGEAYDGVAVPKSEASYDIRLKSAGKIDMLQIQSCSRDVPFQSQDGFFRSGKKFRYTYTPLKGIEDKSSCPLELIASEKIKGRHSWGRIYFQDKKYSLTANLKCNGKDIYTFGKSSSVCQAKAGTIQKIIFSEKVKVSPDSDNCKVMKTKDNLEFTYIMPRDECIYFFGTKNKNFHTLNTFGYDAILVRGE